MWGRLVVAAWQATLSKDLDHLLPLAAAEVAVARSEGGQGVSEGGRGKGNPDLLHHHRGDHQDQGLLRVDDLHQTEAGGMETAAVVVVAAAAAWPAGAADAAGQAAADVAAASSSAEPGAAAASAFPPLPFSFFPPPPLSFSSLPPHLCCPKEEEQAQG